MCDAMIFSPSSCPVSTNSSKDEVENSSPHFFTLFLVGSMNSFLDDANKVVNNHVIKMLYNDAQCLEISLCINSCASTSNSFTLALDEIL